MIKLHEADMIMTDMDVLNAVKDLIKTYVAEGHRHDETKVESVINYLDVLGAITGYNKDFIRGYLNAKK